MVKTSQHVPERARKFRQAAIAYLHYAVLYWFGAYALHQSGLFPSARGPAWVWLAAGAAIALVVTGLLWYWQSIWFARLVWALVALRLPALMRGAFLGGADEVAPGFYLAAGIVVLFVMWMLARAAWDM